MVRAVNLVHQVLALQVARIHSVATQVVLGQPKDRLAHLVAVAAAVLRAWSPLGLRRMLLVVQAAQAAAAGILQARMVWQFPHQPHPEHLVGLGFWLPLTVAVAVVAAAVY
jgi:hypothetical protein